MPTRKASVVWADAGGRTRTTQIITAAGSAAVLAALKAQSNADWMQQWEGDLLAQVPAPVAAPYQDASDAAVLYFQTAAGATVKVTLPAPVAAIFLADGESVDPAAIAAIIAAVIADCVTADGTAITAYVGGLRTAAP